VPAGTVVSPRLRTTAVVLVVFVVILVEGSPTGGIVVVLVTVVVVYDQVSPTERGNLPESVGGVLVVVWICVRVWPENVKEVVTRSWMSAKSECRAREYPETVIAAVSVGPIADPEPEDIIRNAS
jgi:hypothetical protein